MILFHFDYIFLFSLLSRRREKIRQQQHKDRVAAATKETEYIWSRRRKKKLVYLHAVISKKAGRG